MPARPNARNWNDIQTAIATVAVVATLGMWDLFAIPAQGETPQAQEAVIPPTDAPVDAAPTSMPQVKIMFTSAAPQTNTTFQQPQQETKKKKKKNNGGGSVSVTRTHTS